MGGKRFAEQVRRALILAAKTGTVVVLVAGCGGESGGGGVASKAMATCVRVCEAQISCSMGAQARRNCQRYCGTRRGADASVYGSPGVASSCNTDEALAKLNACVDRGCYDMDNCVACVCGSTWVCPYVTMDGG